ncbi:MAG: orotate phosphoribosyltransferase [Proteobacteria bacterium]|nr:orotate phosphoribosyltransferase [Pseudomonadota bacterium]NOG60622.1 orotate phosphoribosyltransferase [Pseudomonadota bacterium]
MEKYQKEFIEFAIEKQVLCFGEFKLKSGRISPYFFNSGLFNDGNSLAQLGKYYAQAVKHSSLEFDMIYGPAYKGIPLASTMAIAFQQDHQSNYPFCFNRKEIKDHGEGGITFGAEINGRVLIIDDVISAGTSIRESMEIITAKGGETVGAVVAVDRQERGLGDQSAIQEVEQVHNIKVISIISLEHIVAYLADHGEMQEHLDAITAYESQYGAVKT